MKYFRNPGFMLALMAGVFLSAPMNAACSEVSPTIREPMASATGLGIGAVSFDASHDELRAALPEADWEDVSVSPFSRRVFVIAAKNAIEIGGRRFDVESLQHYYDRALKLSGAFEMENAADCDKASVEWLTALEPDVGPFAGGEPRRTEGSGGGLYWSTTRLPNGGVSVAPSPRFGSPAKTIDEKVSIGEKSSALATIYDDRNEVVRRKNIGRRRVIFYDLEAYGERNGASVKAVASYVMADGLCEMSLVAALKTPTPGPEYLSFEQSVILNKPTIAERHFILSLIEGGLASPRDYQFDCLVSRLAARADACTRKSAAAESENHADFAYKAARFLAEGYEFDLSGLDRDDPAQLRMVIPVRLAPSDLKSTDFGGRSRTPFNAVRFVSEPTANDVAGAYSRIIGGDLIEATVELVCEIQADGSAICAAAPSSSPSVAAFASAAREATLAYRAAPQLKNGKPSEGVVFELSLRLAPAKPSAVEADVLACKLFGSNSCASEQKPDGE